MDGMGWMGLLGGGRESWDWKGEEGEAEVWQQHFPGQFGAGQRLLGSSESSRSL
jgi:hypothetical protein